jgi:hypothetical protein
MAIEDKPIPESEQETIPAPPANKKRKVIPKENATQKEIPKETELNRAPPAEVNPENCVTINGETIEIHPTKIKYQRNRTAAAYRILEIYPLTDVLAWDKGVIDPERDGDQVVFDFLTAVFDNAKLVTRLYDTMTTGDIERILSIFKRLNKIDEKEEAAKNRAAKETNH